MAQEDYDRIAAQRPADTNEASLYLVQADEQIQGILVICNQDTADRTYRVAIAAESGAAAGADFIEYDTNIATGVGAHRIPIVAGPNRDVRIRASVADKLSFVLIGCRRTLAT